MELPELPPMPDEGLHWHALNYRTAHTLHADDCWRELERFVTAYAREAVLMERERCAQAAEAVAYKDCHQWRRDAIEQAVAAIRSLNPPAEVIEPR